VPRALADDIELYYETFGDRGDPTLLFIAGLGQQLIWWDVEFCLGFVDRGFHVVRYDNRDSGLSSKVDTEVDMMELLAALDGETPPEVPYLLSDLAADAVALLDHLDVGVAHLAGMSMGGMIAQTLALEHPERVASLTSIMSTTGAEDVGQPTADALEALVANLRGDLDRTTAINRAVAQSKITHGAVYFDEAAVTARAGEAYDRCYSPDGTTRLAAAVFASGSRDESLRTIDVPTLVIHGRDDTLIAPSGGERTAEVVPGAELLLLDDMGHSVPTLLWPVFHESITRLAASTAGI
jgi:pimeloyl-ACP methyl ester carboxylesterase